MLLDQPMRTVTPTVDGDALAALAGADDWFTVSRLHSLVPDRSSEGIRKALARLSDQGVVHARQVGRTAMYRLNREHMAAPAIIELAGLRNAFFDRLRNELASWTPQPMLAAVFGSAARGAMSPDSDIDLFLLAPTTDTSDWDEAVDILIDQVTRWTGNHMRPLIMTSEEIHGAWDSEPVLDDISSRAIPVIGDLHVLRRIAKGRS